MKLPNLSFMLRVGQLRYMQAVHERGGYRNPDLVVGELLSPMERFTCSLRGRFLKGRLRASPFYRYVCARTKYYDLVFTDAIGKGFRHIVNIGCGSDTRSYRFAHLLRQKGMRVTECDQAESIRAKQQLIGDRWPSDHVDFLELDLNDPGVPVLQSRLRRIGDGKVLVMLEGVSPYVEEAAYAAFLKMLSSTLPAGSEVAYDFKLPDVAPGFGTTATVERPFRLASSQREVEAFHERVGLKLAYLETSADLTASLVPFEDGIDVAAFAEDVLSRHIVP